MGQKKNSFGVRGDFSRTPNELPAIKNMATRVAERLTWTGSSPYSIGFCIRSMRFYKSRFCFQYTLFTMWCFCISQR